MEDVRQKSTEQPPRMGEQSPRHLDRPHLLDRGWGRLILERMQYRTDLGIRVRNCVAQHRAGVAAWALHHRCRRVWFGTERTRETRHELEVEQFGRLDRTQ